MNIKTIIAIIGGLVALVICGAVAWYLASPLFIDNPVDEAFPFDLPSEDEMEVMSDDEMKALEKEFMAAIPDEAQVAELAPEVKETVVADIMEAAAVVMPDKPMEDEMIDEAEAAWMLAAEGQFVDADNVHQGSGSAKIFQQGEQRVLRLEEFSVTNGPDLHVLLVENGAATSRSDMGEYVDFGSLKGNIGNQNYQIPAEVDLSKYGGVMIYCMPFHVVFSTAAF